MKKYTKNLRKKVATKFTKNDLRFIAFVKSECKRTGIKCDLRPSKWIKCDNIRCSGYFDEVGKRLVVAMNRPDAMGILAHEYGHLTQWEEGMRLWNLSNLSLSKLHYWLDGGRVRNIQKHINVVRDLELDNERRAVRLIKEWNLNIDADKYTKSANAYVMFYNWLYYTRSWSRPKNAPYDNPQILELMSTKFNMRYTQMSRKIYNAFHTAEI